jgi:hypothetical protein
MTQERETPFDSIEGAQEYVILLAESLEEAVRAIQEDKAEAARTAGAERRLQALRLVDYKLNQLREHLSASQRILKDLRTLRRLLLGEREDMQDRP